MATIHDLSNELFWPIIAHLEEYEWLPTERFTRLTQASKRVILSARLVCRDFNDAPPLRASFVHVLEQHPFTINYDDMLILEAVSYSPWAPRMTIISLCALSPSDSHVARTIGFPRAFFTHLGPTIECFMNVRTLRYYPITRHALDRHVSSSLAGSSRMGPMSPSFWTQPADVVSSPNMEPYSDHSLDLIERLFFRKGIRLEAITTPMLGLRSWKTALFPGPLGSNIKRLSLNICNVCPDSIVNCAIISFWIESLSSLEYLDIALTVTNGQQLTWRPTPIICRSTKDRLLSGLWQCPPLTELRIAASSCYFFSEQSILLATAVFPIQRLALAHLQISMGSWWSLLDRLKDRDLELLWVLNPIEAEGIGHDRTGRPTTVVKNTGQMVAKEQRWCIRPDNLNIRREREWDYLGFSMFESG